MPIVLKSSTEALAKYALPEPDESVRIQSVQSARLYAGLLTRLLVSGQYSQEAVRFARDYLPAHYYKTPIKDAGVYYLFSVKFCLQCKTLHKFSSSDLFESMCSSCPENKQKVNGGTYYRARHYSEIVRFTTKEIRLLIEQELHHYAKNYL